MVFTHSNIFTGIVNRSSLANQDIAGLGTLSTEQFNAQAFAV
jgi:hypothetical protein